MPFIAPDQRVGAADCRLAGAVNATAAGALLEQYGRFPALLGEQMNKTFLFAALAVIASAPVLAGTPRLDHREARQVNRIHDGVGSGELTRREARRLGAGQVHLRRAEARAKSDGVVTARERAHLQHEANQQSRRIYRHKHDAQVRN
jgi:hypothetical protein